MAKKKTTSRFASKASEAALVRFGPQLTALQQLADEAAQTYKGTTSNARVAAAGTQAAVDQALPTVKGVYDESGLMQALANGALGGDLAKIQGGGIGVDALKAGAANEQAVMTRNLAQARAGAVADLGSRKTRAAEGAQFATENARNNLIDALTKISAQKLSLGDQQGAFMASTISDLQDAQDTRDFTATQNRLNRQNQANIATGHDQTSRDNAATRRRAAADKKNAGRLPGGAKLQTTTAHSALLGKIDQVKQVAEPLVSQAQKEGHSRHFVARLLTAGVEGGTLHNPATGKIKLDPKTGLEQKAPSIKAQDPLLASVTLDLAYDGHVSAANAKKLHQRGYSLKALGLPGRNSPGSDVRQQGKIADSATNTVAQALADLFGKIK